MRAGVSTVQQTLTSEAAAVLKHAVADACKRGHAQATPLHVAATLLVSPTSPLRRACLQTHPHTNHLPQCRALELCLSIALERLQSAPAPAPTPLTPTSPSNQPSYSNALIAALKRAQAHQRRGCPDQQQQPLLAVKVELEQLVISILDDPSVSRVMREAGFNSTDVKSHLEEMVNVMHSPESHLRHPGGVGVGLGGIDQSGFRLGQSFLGGQHPILGGQPHPVLGGQQQSGLGGQQQSIFNDSQQSILSGFSMPPHLTAILPPQDRTIRPQVVQRTVSHSPYLNPILLKSSCPENMFRPGGGVVVGGGGDDYTKQVEDVLQRRKKKNPLLLGDSLARADSALREVTQLLERGHVSEHLRGVKLLSANLSVMSLMNASKEDLQRLFGELNSSIREVGGGSGGGVIINLGDLQWLLQSGMGGLVSGFCPIQYAVYEIRELLSTHGLDGRVWLIGMTTHQTYQSIQLLHPTLESQWDLQTVPVSTRMPNMSIRYGISQENRPDSLLSLSLISSPPKMRSGDNEGKLTCCPECTRKYEKEALLLQEQEGNIQSESPQSCNSSVEVCNKVGSNDEPQRADTSTTTIGGNLPLWLQKALPNAHSNGAPPVEVKGKVLSIPQRLQELQKKWSQTCRTLHPDRSSGPQMNISQLPSPSSSQVSGGNSSRCQEQQAFGFLKDHSATSSVEHVRPISLLYPGMNGRTMGLSLPIPIATVEAKDSRVIQANTHRERIREDSTACSPAKPRLPWLPVPAVSPPKPPITEAASPNIPVHTQPRGYPPIDPDILVRICKGLAKRISWQPGVISTVASAVVKCRAGLGKRRGLSFRSDAWLLLLGYDRLGKRQMAEALSELLFGEGKKPICLSFGSNVESPLKWSIGSTRGKMPLDQLADAVRQNPSSVVLLEDFEQSDSMFRSRLLHAMERNRLADSCGRDVNFSNVIVLMTSSVGTSWEDFKENYCLDTKTRDGSGSGAPDAVGQPESIEKPTPYNKRKRVGNESEHDSYDGHNKRPNIGLALGLDLNMSAEENDTNNNNNNSNNNSSNKYNNKADRSAAALKPGEADMSIKPEVNEDEILLAARQYLREFCDLADAVVVFSCPL